MSAPLTMLTALSCPFLCFQVMARRQPEARRSILEFDVPPECCSTGVEIWRRVSEFVDAGWTGFVLESERQGDPSSMCVHAVKLADRESSGLVAGEKVDAIRDGSSTALERPTKRARGLGTRNTASVESASADMDQGETVQDSPVDSVPSAQQLPEPTLSLRIRVQDSRGARGTAAPAQAGSHACADLQTGVSSVVVTVEFLTDSASSRSEFWKLAETLKADVLRNNRRWRRRAKLATATTPGADTPVASRLVPSRATADSPDSCEARRM